MKYRRLRNFLYIVVFIGIFLLLYQKISHVLAPKVYDNDTIASFYKEKKNSLDVLFVGSSRAYSSFSPMEAWNERGFTSYTLGTSSQSMPCSYYLIKEGIRTQHPKAVVLETYSAVYDVDYISKARLHTAIDGIPLNATKLELVRELLPNTLNFHESLEFIFPIITYHARWWELKKKDFNITKHYLRGYRPNYKIKAQKEPELTEETEAVYGRTLEYLDKMIEICEENDVKLVLCRTPSGKGKRFDNIRKRTGALIEYAEEKGVACVDFEHLREEIELDYSKDFRDGVHLNSHGGLKVTKYLANYLADACQLTDHRGDEAYRQWEADYEEYAIYDEERRLKAETNAEGQTEEELEE